MNSKVKIIAVLLLVIFLAVLALIYVPDWMEKRLWPDKSSAPFGPNETAPNNLIPANPGPAFAKNQIKIYNDIDDSLATRVVFELRQMEKDSSIKEIEILIDSDGGGVTQTFWICDVMKLVEIKKPIKTVAMDKALSGAALILSSGTKGRRFAVSSSQIMIHRPWVWIINAQMRVEDLEQAARKMRLQEQLLFGLLSENTGQSIEQIRRDIQKDFYMSCQRAIDYGLVDSVYQK